MNEKELRELVERYQKEHFEKWTEWASKPGAEIDDLDVYNKHNLDQLYNQCHFCEISSKSKSSIKSKYAKHEYSRCELCLENISTFSVNCCHDGALWKSFRDDRNSLKERSMLAIKIAYSMRPTDEIVENLKPYLCKQEKWEPKVGHSLDDTTFMIRNNGEIYEVLYDRDIILYDKIGTTYETKKAAEWARDHFFLPTMLLARWLYEHDDGWRANIDDSNQKKFFVKWDKTQPGWTYSWSLTVLILGVTYMSEDNAIKLCTGLNDGTINLWDHNKIGGIK